MGVTLPAGQLVASVADGDPHPPDLDPDGIGRGLHTVAEPTTAYGCDVSTEPVVLHHGKVIMAGGSITKAVFTTRLA